ncbi:unnamed protein product [Brachionus calyciflorus]|uniref:Uncharacterized protein n=1 Tax=Brachionus calyciflorus TaxID=104777 RepID=A0A814E439_9BILA|nr:unnamed protein product [Brachionus calyciflorus]
MDYKLCIETQLRLIYSANNLESHKKKNKFGEFLEDFDDGEIYQKVLEEERENFFTFLLNTDGISLSEKSRLCVWPIFLTINDFQIESRFCLENVILAGLSVSFGKPDLNNLLSSINDGLLKLEIGLNMRKYGYQNYKFFLVAAVFDKPARAAVLNVVNSYGYFGCIKCLQKGTRLKKTPKSSIQTYPFIKKNPDGPKRDNLNYSNDLKIAVETREKCNGIKGKCALNGLKYFNPILNTNIDGMHSLFLGVIKTLFSYWFDSNTDKKYSLKEKMEIIDDNMRKIKPPSFVKTAPRSIFDWKLWRAYEFMSFILHYSLIIFNRIMKIEYLNNLIIFVVCIESLYDRKVSKSNLEKIKILMNDFVSQLTDLYDPFILKSGFHELLHLSECTFHFGPLNSTNCYQFEELNRKITRLIKGQNLVGEEFIKLFSVWQSLSSTKTESDQYNNSPYVEFLEKNSGLKSSNHKKNFKNSQILINNKSFNIYNSNISDIFRETINLDFQRFECVPNVYLNNTLFTDNTYETRFCDSSIFEPDRDLYGKILNIIVVKNEVYFYCQQIIFLHNPFFCPKYPDLKSMFNKRNVLKVNVQNNKNKEKEFINCSNSNQNINSKVVDREQKSKTINNEISKEKKNQIDNASSHNSNSNITEGCSSSINDNMLCLRPKITSSRISIEKINISKNTECKLSQTNQLNEKAKINEKKNLKQSGKNNDNYVLIQWLTDKMYDIVDINRIRNESKNKIQEGLTYDIKYGSGYLKAIVKLKGDKNECEEQLKILSDEDLTSNQSIDDSGDYLDKKIKHLESKLGEMEKALKDEIIQKQKLEVELIKAQEINCLKNTYAWLTVLKLLQNVLERLSVLERLLYIYACFEYIKSKNDDFKFDSIRKLISQLSCEARRDLKKLNFSIEAVKNDKNKIIDYCVYDINGELVESYEKEGSISSKSDNNKDCSKKDDDFSNESFGEKENEVDLETDTE